MVPRLMAQNSPSDFRANFRRSSGARKRIVRSQEFDFPLLLERLAKKLFDSMLYYFFRRAVNARVFFLCYSAHMEEIEVPLEKVTEDMHEHAHHASESWVMRVAICSAFLAALAAVAAMLAGHHSNEAMIDQLRASDQWGYYQAKGVKSAVLASRLELLQALGKPVAEEQKQKLAEYKKEQEEISERAKEKEAESAKHLSTHQILARAVTFFQVAIAIGAIAVLSRRRSFFHVSLLFGFCGLGFFIAAFVIP